MTLSEYKITCCSTADMPAAYFEEKNLPFKYYEIAKRSVKMGII